MPPTDRRRARRRLRRPSVPAGRAPDRACRAARAGSAGSTRPASTTIARTAATGPCPRARARGRSGSSTRSPPRSSSAAAARRSRPAASGRRWRPQPARPHYLVCNADESEPGTFKDRVLLEDDPFALIEAMTIAGFATGRRAGLPLHARRVPARRGAAARTRSTRRARPACWARTSSAPAFAFDIELRRGAGAYICGEETALFESIEGKRGEPRNKPPFPVEVGLFGKPTTVNNVETLVEHPGDRARRRRGLRGDRHRGLDRPEAVLPVGRTSPGRASTRSRSGRPCASCSSSPAACPAARAHPGDPARRRRRRVRRARTRSTPRSRSRAPGRSGRRSARAS